MAYVFKSLRLVCAILLWLSLAGCATIRPAVVVTKFGESDPNAEQALAEQVEDIDVDEPLPKVRVISGSLPEGLQLAEGGSKLVVLEGFEERYEIIGAVEGDYERATSNAFLKNWFWAWDYQEDWRKGYCYWQVPFKILTLGIWSYLVPLHYPCFASIPGEEGERTIALQADMKRAADLMGGNLIILTNSADLFYVVGNSRGVTSGTVKRIALRGFVVRDRGLERGRPGDAKSATRTLPEANEPPDGRVAVDQTE